MTLAIRLVVISDSRFGVLDGQPRGPRIDPHDASSNPSVQPLGR